MSDPKSPPSRQNTAAGCLVRAFWTMIGNAVMFFLAISIAQRDWHALTWRDAAFAAVVALLVAVRFVDVAYLDGKTADGAPATRGDWNRYVALLVGAAVALWLVAHGLGATNWMG